MNGFAATLAILGAVGFPQAFHGIWDESPQACAGQTSTIRIAISEKRISYWESEGTPTELFSAGSKDVRVSLKMLGEGEEWQSQNRFVANEAGDLLFVEALPMRDKPYFKTVWFYHRCPDDTPMGW